jgi:predicted metal-dependent hydrolase
VSADLPALLARADALASEGRFFEAHEELEAAWRDAAGADKTVLQGVIQLAAGLHRLSRDPSRPEGARYLFERGREKLGAARDRLDAGSLADLERRLDALLAEGAVPATFRFGLRAR